MVYVYTENNLVIDIVKVDPFTVFSAEYAAKFIPAPDNVEYMWSYDGSAFHPPANADELKWEPIRLMRSTLLAESDSRVLPDRWAVMTPEKQQEWTVYRQALRDIPQTFATPEEVVWPTKPE